MYNVVDIYIVKKTKIIKLDQIAQKQAFALQEQLGVLGLRKFLQQNLDLLEIRYQQGFHAGVCSQTFNDKIYQSLGGVSEGEFGL